VTVQRLSCISISGWRHKASQRPSSAYRYMHVLHVESLIIQRQLLVSAGCIVPTKPHTLYTKCSGPDGLSVDSLSVGGMVIAALISSPCWQAKSWRHAYCSLDFQPCWQSKSWRHAHCSLDFQPFFYPLLNPFQCNVLTIVRPYFCAFQIFPNKFAGLAVLIKKLSHFLTGNCCFWSRSQSRLPGCSVSKISVVK
jgi:hypothetical protein